MAKKQTATSRLRQNVLRTIARAEKRGYEFSAEVKQKARTGSYQTLASLQRGRYGKLYEQAKVNVGGEEFTGRYYRNVIAPRKAAQKAAQTRRKKRAAEPGAAAEGEIIYNNIKKMMEEYPTPGAKALRDQFNREIERHGFDTVMRALASAPPELVQAAQNVIEYEGDKVANTRAFNRFFNLLKGSIMNVKESKAAGSVADTEGFTNEN